MRETRRKTISINLNKKLDMKKINSYPTGGLCLGILRERPGHGQIGQ